MEYPNNSLFKIVKLCFIVFLVLLLIPSFSFSQTKDSIRVSGKVVNMMGDGIKGVIVYVPGSTYTTQTNNSGQFSLHVKPGNYEILASAVGYLAEKKSIQIEDNNTKHSFDFKLRIDPSTEIDEVIVQGKTGLQEVRETPFNVVALDAKSHYNSTLDLAHLLDKVSGVKIRETGGTGSDMNITLNGFTGRNVRVFMDGVPMQGMGSAFQLNNIPVNMAERIEVYKGVVPIEFGADAMGGVINIVTNRTRNTTVDLSYSYGSFNTHKSNLSLNHTFKSGVNLSINAFQNYSANNYKVKTDYRIFAAQNDGSDGGVWNGGSVWSSDSAWFRRNHDKYRNETIMAQVGVVGKPWADRMLFGITLGQLKRDVQHGAEMRYVYGERTAHSSSILPSFVYQKRDLLIEGLSLRLTGNYNYEKSGSVDTSAYKYSWTGDRRKMEDLRGLGNAFGEASYGLAEYSNSNQSATLNLGYQINPSHSVSINDVLTNYVRKPDLQRVADALFPDLPTAADSMNRNSFKNTFGLEYRFNFRKKWVTNIFAKHYSNRSTGPQTEAGTDATVKREESTSKTGYGIATTYFLRDLQLKASAEKAYRLPNDRELFGDELLEEGNISLRPEESYNYNLGLTLNKSLSTNYSIYVDWSGYYRDTHDFIQTMLARIGDDVNGTSMYRRANHGRVTRLGTDVEARVYYKNVATLGATVTYMDIRDKARYTDQAGLKENGNYNFRMPNLPYYFWNIDASYYVHDLGGKGNTLNFNYTLNYAGKVYKNELAYGSKASKSFIPKQLYSDVSLSYMMHDGKYNISFEANNLENSLRYDNFSLQKPGRSFAVKLRYYFVKR